MTFKWEKFMTEMARGAGEILLSRLDKVHRINWKPGAGIVTEADKQAEKYLMNKIFRKYPESSIITEESGEFEGKSELTWVLDPLDGTTNFAHGFPWFCVSIGLCIDGKREAGAIYQPVTREMYFAERRRGAWLNGRKIRVSKTKQLKDSLLGTGFYYYKGALLQKEMSIFERMNQKALGVRRPGSAAMDLAFVAAGRYDAFWERGLSPWDVAAGYLLVEEAGGKLTDYSGKPTSMLGKEVVASNGALHSKLISTIKDS